MVLPPRLAPWVRWPVYMPSVRSTRTSVNSGYYPAVAVFCITRACMLMNRHRWGFIVVAICGVIGIFAAQFLPQEPASACVSEEEIPGLDKASDADPVAHPDGRSFKSIDPDIDNKVLLSHLPSVHVTHIAIAG